MTGVLLTGLPFVAAPTIAEDLTDAEIRKLLIQQVNSLLLWLPKRPGTRRKRL